MLLKHAVLDQTPLTLLLVLKNTKVHSRIRWSNIGTRMGTGSSTTFVKWNLWIPGLFGRGFLCSCIFDVDLNTAVAIEAGFGPSWVEPLRVCVILPLSLYPPVKAMG